MRIIAIGGEPGAGKSTLMTRFVNHIQPSKMYNEVKLVPYLKQGNIYIFGKYDEGEVFSGTDRMSMAVQPEAIKFLESLSKDSIVLFEGDRLFNASFLEHCVENYDTTIIYLSTEKEIREERYKQRGSEQNETWLNGRETKINRILTNFNLMYNIEKFNHNSIDDQHVVFEFITDLVK
jgi:hypothetical protein